jgi:hypothetical protein
MTIQCLQGLIILVIMELTIACRMVDDMGIKIPRIQFLYQDRK